MKTIDYLRLLMVIMYNKVSTVVFQDNQVLIWIFQSIKLNTFTLKFLSHLSIFCGEHVCSVAQFEK